MLPKNGSAVDTIFRAQLKHAIESVDVESQPSTDMAQIGGKFDHLGNSILD